MDDYGRFVRDWNPAAVPPRLGPPPRPVAPAGLGGAPLSMPTSMGGVGGLMAPPTAPMPPPGLAPPTAPAPAVPAVPAVPTGVPSVGGLMDQFTDPLYGGFQDARQTGRNIFMTTPQPPPQPGLAPGDPGLGGYMPGMMPPALPDPQGEAAMQREDFFAANFPRALEALNRTGLYKGGSDSAFRPDGLGRRLTPTTGGVQPRSMMSGRGGTAY